MYAAGKIPGGFIKREARPSETAILAARLTDRPIRPLFPEGYKDDVQLVITVLSTDQENDPGRHRHDRRVGRADDQRDPVQRPDRRRSASAGSTASSSSTRPTASSRSRSST